MTATRPTTTTAIAPRASALDRPVAMQLAATEYGRFLSALRQLSEVDWARPTDCPGWDLHALAGHVLGMTEMSASIVEQVRQLRGAGLGGGVFIDALTALQVAKHAGDSPPEIITRFARVAPKAVTGRRRAPGFVRRRALPMQQQVGELAESWTFGFLIDVVLTRDTWMHRIDLCRAVGREPELTADHDGVLVADVVAEWAARHEAACSLALTGPAGGTWAWGSGGPELRLDAVEFCRLLSGRGAGAGLLGVQVPF